MLKTHITTTNSSTAFGRYSFRMSIDLWAAVVWKCQGDAQPLELKKKFKYWFIYTSYIRLYYCCTHTGMMMVYMCMYDGLNRGITSYIHNMYRLYSYTSERRGGVMWST